MGRGRVLSIAAVVATAVLAAPGAAGAASASGEPAVILLVVDGLEPENVSPLLTPNLWALAEEGRARRWTNARGIMISETNPNHTAMVTGTYADRSGIVGNRFFNLKTGQREATESPSLILEPTLFDAIEEQRPELRTASVMGKSKLRRLFDCTKTPSGACGPSSANPEGLPVTHVRPDFVGGANEDFDPDAHEDALAEPASGSGYALDNLITNIVIGRHTGPERPDFTFVNLAMVDGFQHLFGSKSLQGRLAVLNADENVGRLVRALRDAGRWEDTVLIVTADHSFQDTGNPVGTDLLHVANQVTPQVTGTLVVLSELLGSCSNGTSFFAVANGGSAAVYIRDAGYDPYASPPTPLSDAQKACLAELRGRALANPAIGEALYRLPVGDAPQTLLSEAHPEWRLDSPRVGELLLTAKDHASFAESRTSTFAVLAGNHGGPTSVPVPLIVASGSPQLRAGADDGSAVSHVDIAPTVAWLLDIEPPTAAEGRVLDEAFSGRP